MNYSYCDHFSIPAGHVQLKAQLTVPRNAKGIVVFTHGEGSGQISPQNKEVAGHLHSHQMATLLFDLLTPEEDKDYFNRFDQELLTKRLVTATVWLESQPAVRGLPIAYFGASTGAAAALNAAALLPWLIDAVVCRGGRPDLALASLQDVKAPVLLIAGALDTDVLKMNEEALKLLPEPKKLEIIPGAGHLFQEPGKMDRVAGMAADWIEKYFQPAIMHA